MLRNDQANLPAAERPTQRNVLEALQRLVKDAGPDDLVCVCFSGHGLLPGKERRSASGFYFIAQDTSAANERETAETAVTRESLYKQLNQMSCPTLLLMDACRSGGVALDQGLFNVGGLQFGPQVLVSCRSHETSKEFPSLRTVAGKQIGHGVFTAAIISSLESNDPHEGQLSSGLPATTTSFSISQLCDNVVQNVPQLLKARRSQDQHSQEPVVSDSEKMSSQTPQTLLSITFPKNTMLRKRGD